jgi:hypothetical protein
LVIFLTGCGGSAGNISANGGTDGNGGTGTGGTGGTGGGGGTPNVTPPPPTFVRSLNLIPSDITWDSVHGRLLASIPSTDTVAPNTVVAIDPIAGTAGTPVAAGNNPHLLTISADSSYLWVGLDGDNAVQRFLLPGLTKDISVAVPNDSFGNKLQPVSLRAARVNPHTIAMISGHWGYSPPGETTYIFDDATPRPISKPGFFIDWIEWGKDDSVLYGSQYTTIDGAGGVTTLHVDSSGVSYQGGGGGGLLGDGYAISYDTKTGLVYSIQGDVADPVLHTAVGQFNLSAAAGSEVCTQDSVLNRYYCVLNVFSGTDVNQFELWVFDLHTYGLVQRVSLGSTISGRGNKLIRWGNAGLALITSAGAYDGAAGLFLIDGAAVNPNATPDASTGASVSAIPFLASLSPQAGQAGGGDVNVMITGTNFTPQSSLCHNCNFLQLQTLPTTYVSSTQLTATIPASVLQTAGTLSMSVYDSGTKKFGNNSLGFTVYPQSSGSTKVTALNLTGLDMAWDPKSALLYVGTADSDPAYPNSIVALNPVTGIVSMSQTVSPNPFHLSMSAGGQYLYFGYASATNMTQLQLPGLDSPNTWPLISPTLGGGYFAGDLKAAPVNPHTTAVALYIQPYDLDYTSVATGGVVIYDDGVERPQGASAYVFPSPEYNVLAWGATDSVLAAAMNDNYDLLPLYTLSVNATGVSFLKENPSFNEMFNEIHSDFGTGLIYSDDGKVADPVTGMIVGSYPASGLLAPDSTLNRVFILGQTSSQAGSNNYTIGSFDQKSFAAVSTITVNNVLGSPTTLVRWGASGLALITVNENAGTFGGPGGMLYLLQDATFVSGSSATSSAQSVRDEEIQQRWSRPSKGHFVKGAVVGNYRK